MPAPLTQPLTEPMTAPLTEPPEAVLTVGAKRSLSAPLQEQAVCGPR